MSKKKKIPDKKRRNISKKKQKEVLEYFGKFKVLSIKNFSDLSKTSYEHSKKLITQMVNKYKVLKKFSILANAVFFYGMTGKGKNLLYGVKKEYNKTRFDINTYKHNQEVVNFVVDNNLKIDEYMCEYEIMLEIMKLTEKQPWYSREKNEIKTFEKEKQFEDDEEDELVEDDKELTEEDLLIKKWEKKVSTNNPNSKQKNKSKLLTHLANHLKKEKIPDLFLKKWIELKAKNGIYNLQKNSAVEIELVIKNAKQYQKNFAKYEKTEGINEVYYLCSAIVYSKINSFIKNKRINIPKKITLIKYFD